MRESISILLVLLVSLLVITAPLRAKITSHNNDEQEVDDGQRKDIPAFVPPSLGVFCADNGQYSGTSEVSFIEKRLVNTTKYQVAECQSVTSGWIVPKKNPASPVPTLVVTTGIGALNALACSSAVQRKFSSLQKIIFTGTSGWSSFVGGLDASSGSECSTLPAKLNSGKVSVGSICFTSTAALFACGVCVKDDDLQSSSECWKPNCNSRSKEDLFGKCTFSEADDLSSELQSVARSMTASGSMPEMSVVLKMLSRQYWAAVDTANPNDFPTMPIFPNNCLEMDEEKIESNAQSDILCRNYVADIFNKKAGANELSANDVVCAAAMEGVGFLRAVANFPSKVQIAIVRGKSNENTYPLRRAPWPTGVSGIEAPRWIQQVNYTEAKNHEQLVTEGYHFAIQTTNAVILEWIDSQN